MSHPVWNVDVDAINSRGGDLPDSFHVPLSTLRRIGADPYIFISFGDPKRGAAAKNCGLAVDLALQPVGMILCECVGCRVRIRGDAFRPGDIHVGVVSHSVGFLGNGTNRFQFCFWVKEALVTAWYVVVNLDTRDTVIFGAGYDFAGIVGCQPIPTGAHIVGPVLLGGTGGLRSRASLPGQWKLEDCQGHAHDQSTNPTSNPHDSPPGRLPVLRIGKAPQTAGSVLTQWRDKQSLIPVLELLEPEALLRQETEKLAH